MTQPSVREHAIKLREKSPCMTLQAIGDKCGVSKERVRQILQSEGMETKLLALPLCDRIQSNFDVRVHSLI
jgi:PP-loop superfamily ATP-utilizing enzyme